MLRKLYVGLFICLLSFTGLQAQDPLTFVPEDAFAVTVVDLGELDKAIDFEALRNSEVFKKLEEEAKKGPSELFSKILNDPSITGVDVSARVLLTQFVSGKMTVSRLILPLKDADLFAKAVEEIAKTSPSGFVKSKKGKFQFYSDKNEGSIGWNGKLAVVTFILDDNTDLYKELDYSDSLFSEKLEARKAERKLLKNKELAVQMLDLVNKRSRSKNVTSIQNFQEFYAGKLQIGSWMNFGKLARTTFAKIPDGETNEEGKRIIAKLIDSMEGSTFIRSYTDFVDDKVEMRQQIGGGKELADKMSAALDRKVSDKLMKYIPGKEALFVFSMAADLEKAGTALTEYTFALTGDMEESKKASAVYDVLAIFLDEKAIFELLPGEMVGAVTDVREVEMKYTTYDYDEDYNRIEVEKTRKQTMPIFTLAYGVGNLENSKKLLDALELAQQLEKEGEGYRIINPDFPKDMLFLALTEDALIFTNDDNVIANPSKGAASANQFTSETKSLIQGNNFFANLDLNAILLESGPMVKKIAPAMQNQESIEKIAKLLRDLRMTGIERKGNMMEVKWELLLRKGSGNSVNSIVDLIDTFLEEKKEEGSKN